MADKDIPEPVIKGVIEYAAKLRSELEQVDRAIAKAKEELLAREALVISMKSQLKEVETFLKANAPESMFHQDLLEMPSWVEGAREFPERQIAWTQVRQKYVPPPPWAKKSLGQRYVPGAAKKALVLDIALQMMREGQRVTTAEIDDRLREMGVDLEVANPPTRISQILSEDDRFITIRGIGWALKGEDPAGTGSSSAT